MRQEAYYRWLTVFTPENIESVKLRRAVFGGYRAGETRQYLRQIAWELSRALHERGMFEEESRRFRAQLLRHERREELERSTRAGAREDARELLEDARHDAELILKKAYKHASEIRAAAEKDVASQVAESNELEERNSTMRRELRTLLTSVLEALESIAETPKKDYRPGMTDDLRKAMTSAAAQTVSELNPDLAARRDGGWAKPESEPAVSAEDEESASGDERVA